MAQPSQADVRKADIAASQSSGGSAVSASTGNAEITFLEEAIRQVLSLGNKPMPEFHQPSQAPLLQVLDSFKTIAEQALSTTKTGVEASKKAGEDMKRGVTLDAAATQDTIAANADRARQVAENAGRFVSMFAGNNAERIASLAEQKKMLEDKIILDKQEILRRQSISPLEHPIDWVVAQLTTPGKIVEHNVLANQINSLETSIEQAITAASRMTELSAQTIPAITSRQAAAAGKVAEAAAVQKSAAVDIAAAEHNIDFANRQIAVAKATVDAETTIYTKRFEASMADFNTRINAIQREENSADRRLRLAEFVATLNDKKVIASILSNAEKAAGVPAGTFNPTRWKLMSKDQQEAVIAIGVGSGGANPVDALNTYREVGVGANLDPRRRIMLTNTADLVNSVRSENGYKQQTGKEAQEAYVRKRVTEEFGKYLATPDSPDPKNPYRALGVQELFLADPLLQHTPAGKILSQFKDVKASVTSDQIVEAIFTGTNGDARAAANAISDYFKRNIIKRDELMQYPSVGLRAPAVISYKSKFKLPSKAVGFGDSDVVVDLVNPAEVENFLRRRDIARKIQETVPPNIMAP